MIFKTFDSDKDTFSSKFGILGKSFEDIGNRFKKVSDELIATNDYTISNIANAWKNSSIKKDLSDKFIITKSDIEDKLKDLSVYEQNPSDILKDLQKINNASKLDPTAWQKYFDTLTEGEKWQEKFVQTNDLTKVSLDDVKNAQNAAKQSAIAYNNGLEQMTIGAKAASVGLKALSIAGNMVAMWAITKGIELAATAIDNYVHRVEKANEAMSEAVSENDSAKSALENTTKELDEQNKRIAELQSKGTLTYVEQEELDKLKETTKQLQLQEDIEKRKAEQSSKEQAEKTVDAYNKQYGKQDINKASVENKLDISDGVPTSKGVDDIVGNIAALEYHTNKLTEAQENYNEAVKNDDGVEYAKAYLDYYTESIDDYKDTLDNTVTDLLEKQQNLQEAYDAAMEKKNNGETLSTSEQDTLDTYNKIVDAMKLIYQYTDQAGWNNIQFNDIFNTDGIEKSKDELIDLAQAGSLTEDELKKYPNLYQAIKSADFLGDDIDNAEEFINQIKASQDAVEDLGNTEVDTDTFSIPDADTLQQQISDLNSAIDSIQSAYDTLNSAVEEYNSNGGQLSIDTIQSLLSLSDEYLACLQVENGQLSLNADAMAQLAQSKLDEAQATAVTQAMTELQAIANGEAAQSTTNYITGNAALMNSLAQLSGSYDGVAQAAMTAAQAQELSAQISAASAKDKTATENVMKGLDNKLKMIQITKKSISTGHFGTVAKKASSSGSGSKSGSGSGNSAKDAEKEAEEYVDKYMSYQKAMLEGGKTDYQTYTKNVKSMLDDMYNSGKISTKKYFSSVKDMIDEQKTIYEKALKAVTSRLEKEIDLWQAKIDALKKENDKLNDQKDTYDGILSAVKDVIDAETDRYQNLIDNLDKANDKLNESKDDKDGILSAISDVYDEQIDALNKQSDALDEQIQKLQDTNDELDKQYQKEKAIYALEQAQRLRNKKVYMDGKGYIYTQDQEAIRDAKKDLSDIETDEAISKLEKEKEKLSDAISNLEKYKELWAEVSNAHGKETNKQLAIAQYGKDFEKIILLNRESDINAFKNSYIAIQKELDNNQSLIDSYNEKVEYYNKLKEQWSSISNAYDVNANKQAAIAQWGSGFEQMILSGRIQNITAFKDQYLAIQSQINNNEQLINSYNEKVDYYNRLKDQWGNTTSVYENELNAQYAAQVLGAGWETDVLNGRLDVMRKFTNEYKSLCQQQADAAINAANAEVTARNNANSGTMSGGTDVGSGVSGGSSAPISSGVVARTYTYIVKDDHDQSLYSTNDQKTVLPWTKKYGFIISRRDDRRSSSGVMIYYVKKKGTSFKKSGGGGGGSSRVSNKMLMSTMSEGGIVTASKGTLVTSYDNPLNVIAQSMGEDTMIAAKKGERILTPEQNEMWERWTKAMPKLMSYLPNIEYDLDKTNASELKGNNKTVNLNQNVTIQCPNVTNTNGAEYIVKFLRSASADALVYSKK